MTSQSQDYSLVRQPITINGVEIPSRIVRTSHGSGLPVGPDLTAYHSGPARSGVGLSFLDVATVHPMSAGAIRVDRDEFMGPYEQMITELHRWPMRLFQQLWFGGRTFARPDGGPPWSASAVPGPRVAATDLSTVPLAVTRSQLEDLVTAFAVGARRAVDAGVDGIEIHSAHGYFLGQFLSPLTNLREDEYGGSLENRMRLLVQILSEVRSAIGPAIPLGIRISANEMIDGGLQTEEAAEISQRLDQAALIDFLDISLGSPMNYTKVIGGMDEPSGYELPYSAIVARDISVPTIVGGRVKTLAHAEEILRRGDAQMVSMVRAHIADPELVAKTLAGAAATVRPCIGCNQGCVGAKSSPGARFGCAVNPSAGFERLEPPVRRSAPMRVLVAGGGPAGLEAARSAAERGDQVILCEATGELGGQLRLARRAPHRAEIGEIVDWLVAEVKRLGVDVRLNCRVDAAYVRSVPASRVIVATGSTPRAGAFQIANPSVPVPGADHGHVFTAWDVLSGSDLPDGRVLVFDDVGHHEAVSVAEWLLAEGREVVMASRLNRLAPMLESARLEGTIKRRLAAQPFEFVPDTRLGRIEQGAVTIESIYGGADRTVEVAAVVVVGANRPQRDLFDELGSEVDSALVGDALGPRYLQLAMLEAHRAAQRD